MFKIADPDSAVFVVLSIDGKARTLSLAPHDERVLIVGSMAQAEFRIDATGVSPIQFHFERHEAAVWLIPAYSSTALHLNDTRVIGPEPLEQRNQIDFCGLRIDVTIVEANSFEADSDSLATSEVHARELRASYSLELPGEEDTTQPAMKPVPILDEPDDYPTTVFTPVRPSESDAAPESTTRTAASTSASLPFEGSARSLDTTQRIAPFRQPPLLEDDSPVLTLNGTEIMAPYRPGVALAPDGATPINHGVPNMPHRQAPQGDSADNVRLVPLSHAPRPVPPHWRPSAMTQIEPSETQRVKPQPVHAAIVALGSSPPLARHQATPIARPSDSRAVITPRAGVKPANFPRHARASWLTQLGLMAKARPLMVISGAIAGGALLAAALSVATHLAANHHVRPALTATLNSLQATPTGPIPVAPKQPKSAP